MSDYCGCDDLERPSVFEETLVRAARKEYVCDECRRLILPGESYRRIFGVWPTIDGAATYLTCARCMVIEEWVKAHIPCACIELGNLLDLARQEIEECVEPDVLLPEFTALMADVLAAPKPPLSKGRS